MCTCCTLTDQTEANIRGTIALAVAETNTAYDRSGVLIELRLVHAYLDADYVEPSFSSSLSQLRSKTDGKLDSVHAKRDQYEADIVALIIDDPQYCGIAYLGPSESLMFSVTAWNCATGYYSFGHEIGHNMVCVHSCLSNLFLIIFSSRELLYNDRDSNTKSPIPSKTFRFPKSKTPVRYTESYESQ